MAAQKLLRWPVGAAGAADRGCFLLPFWGFFLCFSAFLMLEVLFKEETRTLLEPTFGTAPCHPSHGQVQGSTAESCCSPSLPWLGVATTDDEPLLPASQ